MAQENKSKVSILTNGIIKENPVLRLVLGTCSILAVTTAVSSALGMGAAFTFVLVCSNIMISLLRKVIPGKVHLPCYIVIIASFVTIVQMFMQAYMESLYNALGVFLPLIVVNCIRLLPLALQTLYHLFDFFVVKVFFVRYNLLGKCRSLIYTGGSLK